MLIFAAAGNEGGNRGVAFPANLCAQGDVIRINSSDSKGKISTFSPDAGQGQRICTLGEGLPSCEMRSDKDIKCRSGTSFATPIAAAIAAILLGFIGNIKPIDLEHNGLPRNHMEFTRRLRTKLGMEKVMRQTCVDRSSAQSGVSYIAPWFFWGIHETSRVHIVFDVLRQVS